LDRILITGGAGFIGSHVADELLRKGVRVRVLDNLCKQVHPERKRPSYLASDVELIIGDVRDSRTIRRALAGVDKVIHLAAMVGVGQSMYEISEYTQVNNVGTAVLLEALVENPIQKLVIASSMSIYGEGLYCDMDGTPHPGATRTPEQLKLNQWDPISSDGEVLHPVATPEWKPPSLASIYALSKFDQEQMCLMIGRAYGIPTVALRFFNVFGPRQALSNPYTGVLAIFAARLLNEQAPLIFEDGRQLRDFVSVYDVARACRLALESSAADGQALNIGSGQRYSICEIATGIAAALGKRISPQISGKYRVGDIRHCFPDISLSEKLLGYRPRVTLKDGLLDLAAWIETQTAVDRFTVAQDELTLRGLVV